MAWQWWLHMRVCGDNGHVDAGHEIIKMFVIHNIDDNLYLRVKTKYNKIWQYLLRNKLLHLLNPVKKRDYIHMSNNDFINWAHKNFKSYTEFSNHKSYQLALKRKVKNKIKLLFDIQKTNV